MQDAKYQVEHMQVPHASAALHSLRRPPVVQLSNNTDAIRAMQPITGQSRALKPCLTHFLKPIGLRIGVVPPALSRPTGQLRNSAEQHVPCGQSSAANLQKW